MEYVNKVQLSGEISEIRKSERGTCFIMLRQLVNYNGEEHTRLFEVMIPAERQDLIDKIAVERKIFINGVLTVFRVKKLNTHKIIVNAEQIDIVE